MPDHKKPEQQKPQQQQAPPQSAQTPKASDKPTDEQTSAEQRDTMEAQGGIPRRTEEPQSLQDIRDLAHPDKSLHPEQLLPQPAGPVPPDIASPTGPRKYVVLAGSLGADHVRGQVITGEGFDQKRLDQLVANGSLREATGLESQHDTVNLDTTSAPQSVEAELDRLRQQVRVLESENSQLRRDADQMKLVKNPLETAPKVQEPLEKVIKEKDRVILELQARLKEKEK